METQQSVQGRNGVLTVCEWSHSVAGGIREFLCVKPPHTQDYEIPVCEGVTHRYYRLTACVGGGGGGSYAENAVCDGHILLLYLGHTQHTHTHHTQTTHTTHT